MILTTSLRQIAEYSLQFLPAPLKYGSKYRHIKKLIKETEYWSKEQIYDYQLEQLQKIILYAYDYVPYYTEVFNREGINPSEIKEIRDIQKIPYLTKDIIIKNPEKLKAINIKDNRLRYSTTGGSTGTPMGFYKEKGHGWIEWAFMTSQWERIGYKDSDKCVILRGPVVDNIIEGKKYWAHSNWLHPNWLVMSSYHLNDDNIPLYISKIRKFKPKFIQAYPSSLQILAEYMERNGILPFDGLEGVFCGSESTYSFQRTLFEKVFKTRVYTWYGHTETVCLAGECEVSSKYHAFPQYGYTELINQDNKLCTDEGEKGEIVATGFWNYYFPFIRYKTQDIGINSNKICECGRNWKIIDSVEGRLQDYVIGRNNEKITLTALIFAQHFHAFSKIKEMQLHQQQKGIITIRIIEHESLNRNDKNEIMSKIKNASNNSVQVNIEYVSDIKRTISGKKRFLIQELDI